jgi:hypothetical protein
MLLIMVPTPSAYFKSKKIISFNLVWRLQTLPSALHHSSISIIFPNGAVTESATGNALSHAAADLLLLKRL